MMSAIQSFCLEFLAFSPLWMLVVIRCVNSIWILNSGNLLSEKVGLIGIGIAFVVAIGCIGYCRRKAFLGTDKDSWRIVSCREAKLVTVRFLIENVFPLFCFDCTTGEGLALTTVYFAVLAMVAAKHRHFPVCIWLEWLGYSYYDCRICYSGNNTAERDVVVVSRKSLYQVKCDLWLSQINDETYLCVGERER